MSLRLVKKLNKCKPFDLLNECNKVYQFAEFFAGQGRLTDSLREAQYMGVGLDIEYIGGPAMDLTTPSGMAFLCLKIEEE